MKASSAFTIEQLRSKDFTEKWGCEASIMDYGRFNYVAQPGDGARLIPKIGPYDFFAVDWGYREFAAGLSAEQEQAELNRIVARQVDDPVLRFSDPNPFLDPSAQTEDLGSDGVAATELGLKNIDRVASYLVKATCKEGKDYELLRNMYDALVGQRDLELNHVVAIVGGVVYSNLWYGQSERQFDPVPVERQRAAVAFLLQHAFQVPPTLIAPEIVDRLQPNGAVDRFRASQVNILRYLTNTLRLRRMAEFEARAPGASYGPAALLEDLRRGLFVELDRERVTVDLYRRNTQRAWVDLMVDYVAQNSRDSDVSALARAELKVLLQHMNDVLIKTADRATQVHLTDLIDRADRALDPRGKN
ncbi:MAG: zinc-dependent metalloprotease [Planctomycetes bacterium]|nr:zinc-dependent metalloprotease [Planctomycetota bacterium]